MPKGHYSRDARRATNMHLISTVGVGSDTDRYSKLMCVECRCPEEREVTFKRSANGAGLPTGGVICCRDCEAPNVEDKTPRHYQLQYDTTYRELPEKATEKTRIAPVRLARVDGARGVRWREEVFLMVEGRGRERERASNEQGKKKLTSSFSFSFPFFFRNPPPNQVGERIEYEVPQHPEGKQHVSSYDFTLNDLLEGKEKCFFFLPRFFLFSAKRKKEKLENSTSLSPSSPPPPPPPLPLQAPSSPSPSSSFAATATSTWAASA